MTLPPWWHRAWYRLLNQSETGWLWLGILGLAALLVWLVAYVGISVSRNPQDTLQRRY